MHEHKDGVAACRLDWLQALETGPAVAAPATNIIERAAMPAHNTAFVMSLPLASGRGFPSPQVIHYPNYAGGQNIFQACQALGANPPQFVSNCATICASVRRRPKV
jgi:hypothetical protein